MLTRCPVCDTEFERNKLSQKYCSEDCRLAMVRKRDRERKRKERAEEKAIRDKEKQRIQQAKEEARKKAELERVKAKEQEQQKLKTRAKLGDPKARMELADRFSAEYWAAFRDAEIQQSKLYEKRFVRYVNGISVYDDDFVEKVMILIREQGVIYTELISDEAEKRFVY